MTSTRRKAIDRPIINISNRIKGKLVFRVVLGILTAMLTMGIVLLLLAYSWFFRSLYDVYKGNLERVTVTASSWFDNGELEHIIREGEDSEAYREMQAELINYCRWQDLIYISVVRPNADYTQETFFFDVSVNNAVDQYEPFSTHPLRNQDFVRAYQKIYEEGSFQETITKMDRDSESPYIAILIPIFGEYNEETDEMEIVAVLQVRDSIDEVQSLHTEFRQRALAATLLLSVLTAFLYWLFLHHDVLQPIQVIADETDRFSADNEPAETKLSEKIFADNEIGSLAASIDEMEEQIEQHLTDVRKLTIARNKAETELELGAQIQSAALPAKKESIAARPEIEIASYIRPAREVGGDFFDYFLVDDDHLALLIADVSDKGVPAALFMMGCKMTLKTVAEPGRKPSEILGDVNNRLCREKIGDMFVTVWLGILQLSTGRLITSNGGHEYPVIRQGGGAFRLIRDPHGLVLGGMEDMVYKDFELQLQPGDTLFVYTDGVPEASSREKELMGLDRTLQALNVTPEGRPDELIANVIDAIDTFVDGEPQFDDITMLCVSWRGPAGERTEDTCHRQKTSAESY